MKSFENIQKRPPPSPPYTKQRMLVFSVWIGHYTHNCIRYNKSNVNTRIDNGILTIWKQSIDIYRVRLIKDPFLIHEKHFPGLIRKSEKEGLGTRRKHSRFPCRYMRCSCRYTFLCMYQRPVIDDFFCPACLRSFKSKAGLKSHLRLLRGTSCRGTVQSYTT